MSQRNINNARYQEGGKKNVTRKGAGSAKVKSSAASSVYVKKVTDKDKAKKDAKTRDLKEKREAAQSKDRAEMSKDDMALADYRKWRRIWLALIIISIIGIAVSFGSQYLMAEGKLLEAATGVRRTVQIVCLVVGYAGIIGALIVDFRHMRPIRKMSGGQSTKESKKERQHREAAEAEKAAKKAARRFGKKNK